MAKKRTNTLAELIKQQNQATQTMNPDPSLPSQENTEYAKSFPGGRETLLNVPDRKELPPEPTGPGRKCTLIRMVTESPELYAQLITYIQAGAYYHVAAEAVGVSTDALRGWLKKGRGDLLSLNDTWYSRLLLDIRRAVALARVSAEISIAETNSTRWLNQGPGRMFGDHWLDSEKKNQREDGDSDDTVDAIGEVISSTQALEDHSQPVDESNTVVLRVDPSEELARIEALESAGLASYSEAHKEALRRQIQHTKD
jgi:hypothetical protein